MAVLGLKSDKFTYVAAVTTLLTIRSSHRSGDRHGFQAFHNPSSHSNGVWLCFLESYLLWPKFGTVFRTHTVQGRRNWTATQPQAAASHIFGVVQRQVSWFAAALWISKNPSTGLKHLTLLLDPNFHWLNSTVLQFQLLIYGGRHVHFRWLNSMMSLLGGVPLIFFGTLSSTSAAHDITQSLPCLVWSRSSLGW